MTINLYETVNVSLDPALKEQVLNRTINSVRCSKCRRDIELATNLLYHDIKKELMIWLRLDKVRGGEMTMRYRTLRIVHSYEALVEKILIYDAALNDCTVELLKFVLWPQVSGKATEFYRGNEIRFTALDSENLHFTITMDERRKSFTFPKSEATKVDSISAKEKAKATSGNWHLVDRDFIIAVAFGAEPGARANVISQGLRR